MYKVKIDVLENFKKQLDANNKELSAIAKGDRNVNNINVSGKIINLINKNKKLIKFIQDEYYIS